MIKRSLLSFYSLTLSICFCLLFGIATNSMAQSKEGEISKKKYRGDGKALIGVALYVIELQPNRKTNKSTQPTQSTSPTNTTKNPHWVYRVQFVLPDSAAFKAKIQPDDIILSWDGRTLDSQATATRHSALSTYLKQHKRVGEPLQIKLLRFNSAIKVDDNELTPLRQSNWQNLSNHPGNPQTQKIVLKHTTNYSQKRLILGSRAGTKKLPENHLLAPSNLPPDPTFGLLDNVVKTFNLKEDYQDLLQRFEENQRWDKGFRLSRFRYVHRQPEKLLPLAQQMTDQIVQMSSAPYQQLQQQPQQLIQQLSLFNDLKTSTTQQSLTTGQLQWSPTLNEQLNFIEQTLHQATELRQQALAQLSPEETKELTDLLPQVMARFANSYYIASGKQLFDQDRQNHRLLELIKQVDLNKLVAASQVLLRLHDKYWQRHLQQIAQQTSSTDAILAARKTPSGMIYIGSKENNVYHQPATVIIDLGGNDQYFGAADAPINLIIDLQGNDRYSSAVPFAQGSVMLGVSMLLDYQGNDYYYGSYYSQGTAIGGVGLLFDSAGDDYYWGQRFSQGVGFWGIGLLLDNAGNDRYQAWQYAQGVGGVKGIGLLLDKQGNDYYQATGEARSTYGTIGNFHASSQGFGVGFRGYASGGIGFLVDQQGTDNYQVGNFGQGVGYFYGLGILRDLGNNDDNYHASRYGLAASAHSAAGVLIEDGGNDNYQGQHIALLSAAWDLSLSAFWDKGGDDNYRQTPQGFSIGVASHNGHSLFLDSGGKDNYRFDKMQQQAGNNDYHGGASMALFIDAGGESDNYHSKYFANNQQRIETTHGFLIDLATPLTGSLPPLKTEPSTELSTEPSTKSATQSTTK